jgi:hypothetical protein
MRGQLGQRRFGQPPVGGDLAAEDVEQRRAAVAASSEST